MDEVKTGARQGMRSDLERLGPPIIAGFVGGAIAGFLVGGVGGRLVMFVLRLTSSDALRGRKTDDDFVIGRFSSGTFFLVMATTLLGAIGGVVYVGLRRFLPEGRRWLPTAALTGLIGGALVVEADGIDFTELDPLWFAVVSFIALPAAYGWLMSVLVERRIARPRRAALWMLLPLVPLLLTGPPGIVVVVVCLAAGPAMRAWPGLATVVRSSAVTWAGRVVLGLVAALALVELVDDVGAIL